MKEMYKIFEIVKKVKGYYAIFIPGKGIICTDESFTYLKCVPCIIDFNYNLFMCNKVITKILKDPSMRYDEDTFTFYYTDNNVPKIYKLNDMYAYNKILEMYLNTMNYKSCTNVIYQNEEMRKEEEFEQALALKSKEGTAFYRVNEQYILTLFSGLLPINKADKVTLNINSISSDNTFLASFKIAKKGMDVEVYIKYLKI